MRGFFFAPFKAISSTIPSGDREIARGIYAYLISQKEDIRILSIFHSLFFWINVWGILLYIPFFLLALLRVIWFRPHYFFTYHVYYKAPDPFAFILAKLFSRPHFIFEGMYSVSPRTKWKTWPGWYLTRGAISAAAHVFTDKKIDMEGLAKLLPASKITYIPPSIDTSFFLRKLDQREILRKKYKIAPIPIIIGVAMLRPDRKSEGVEFLLQCLADLANEGIDFFYLHIGDGERLEALSAMAQKRLPNKHKFVGRLKKEQIRDHLSAADIFAFPGIDEAFGMVYVEAQACSLPVVAFKNGGISESVADGLSGFLTALMDKEAMKDSLRKLLKDQNMREKMGRAARDFVEKSFDREKNYKKMFDIISAEIKKEPSV